MIRFLLKLHSCIIALLAGSEYMGCFNTPLFSHLDATLDFRLNCVDCVGNEAHSGFYFFLFRCRYQLLAGAFNCSCFGRHSGPGIVLFHCLLSVSVIRCLCLLSVVCVCCPLSMPVVRCMCLLSGITQLAVVCGTKALLPWEILPPRAISAAMSERVVLRDHLVLDLN